MDMITGINANTGREIQVERASLINTYMPEGWTEMISAAIEKSLAERAASGDGPRNGINALIDGEYHFFSFDGGCGGELSESELFSFIERFNESPCMNTLWTILAELSRMGVVDGFAAFNEYQQSQKREQLGCDSFGIVSNDKAGVEGVIARLENVRYAISIDRSKDAAELREEAKKYEKLQSMIKLITGA